MNGKLSALTGDGEVASIGGTGLGLALAALGMRDGVRELASRGEVVRALKFCTEIEHKSVAYAMDFDLESEVGFFMEVLHEMWRSDQNEINLRVS